MPEPLTSREERIVKLLNAGATVDGIARILQVEPVVIEGELREIREKLGRDDASDG